jgi:hypothetical protein
MRLDRVVVKGGAAPLVAVRYEGHQRLHRWFGEAEGLKVSLAYQSAVRLNKAIDLSQQVLAECERVLSRNHPLTAAVRDNLVSARGARVGR